MVKGDAKGVRISPEFAEIVANFALQTKSNKATFQTFKNDSNWGNRSERCIKDLIAMYVKNSSNSIAAKSLDGRKAKQRKYVYEEEVHALMERHVNPDNLECGRYHSLRDLLAILKERVFLNCVSHITN